MKKTIAIIILLVTGVLIWYLLIKPYDYLITFKIKANTGTINQSLKLWNTTLDSAKILGKNDLDNIVQQITFNDSTFIYDWNINLINDSLSKVSVYIKDIDHSLKNKIEIPFINSNFKKKSIKTVLEFAKYLQEHIKNIRITIKGNNQLSGAYCIYIPIKSSQFDKAKGMMRYYPEISNFIVENGIKSKGDPFIEVTNWDIENDSIQFNFCFPIIKKDSLPKDKLLKYKQFDGLNNAIKAIYNGNYITSDRAWYSLLDYAAKNNICIEKKPIEIFYNNPNMGGNALNWKTEVFLPIK